MTTVPSLFQQAQLAEAAYANFWNAATNTTITAPTLVTAALIASGFAAGANGQSTQATAFAAQWQVIDQIPDTASGFSATLFKNTTTGSYSLAIKGSTFDSAGLDFLADASLITQDGVAVNQLIDMYNYWQSLNTLGTYQAAYLQTNLTETVAMTALWTAAKIPGAAVPAIAAYQAYKAQLESAGYLVQGGSVSTVAFRLSYQVLAGTPLASGSGKLAACPAALDVVGHSLGGHLAMAFTRLFPSIASNALAVNGLGFKNQTANRATGSRQDCPSTRATTRRTIATTKRPSANPHRPASARQGGCSPFLMVITKRRGEHPPCRSGATRASRTTTVQRSRCGFSTDAGFRQ